MKKFLFLLVIGIDIFVGNIALCGGGQSKAMLSKKSEEMEHITTPSQSWSESFTDAISCNKVNYILVRRRDNIKTTENCAQISPLAPQIAFYIFEY